MGTKADSNDEWIELYNPGLSSVNLLGWQLKALDGAPAINLAGVIPAGGYFLLERTDNDVVSDIAADQVYSGALANDSESLQLLAPGGLLVDTANSNGGAWPAGNPSTFCSMERAGANLADGDAAWMTNTGQVANGEDVAANKICGTPRSANWAYTVTATASPTLTSTRTFTPVRTSTPARTPTPAKTATRTPIYVTPSSIIINEFLPRPRSDWNADGKVDSGDEFIEISNLSSLPVALSGWELDDQDGDSSPYTIKDTTIEPGARLVFFAAQTGIRLGSGGDSVRLYKSGGQLSDAFTYDIVEATDLSWCRLPDGGSNWQFGCFPTVTESNQLAGNAPASSLSESLLCSGGQFPADAYLAECGQPREGNQSQPLDEALPKDFPRFFEMENERFILE